MHGWWSGPWRMRLYYFGFFLAAGINFPYAGLYFKAIHLNGSQIGLLISISPLVGALLPAVWGTLSDRYFWRNRIVRICLVVAALVAPLVPLVGPFPLLLLVMALLAVVLSPAVPLADSATLETLEGAANRFGTVRMFGSIGFLLSSVVLGQVLAGNHIVWLFPIYGGALAAAALCSLGMPGQTRRERAERGEGIRFVLRDARISVFLALVIVGYTSFAAYNAFFSLYLQGLGGGTGIVGIATAIATLSELPGMILGGYAIKRFGIKAVLLLGLGSCFARWMAYALIHDYRLALVFQPLHGLGFAAFYMAGVAYVDALVPTRLRATGQTLFSVSFLGLGSVIGSNLFGALYDRLQGNGMFFVAAAIVVPAWVGMALLVANPRVEDQADEGA
jgi:PPP family 3-phenylpropionic acid transporter